MKGLKFHPVPAEEGDMDILKRLRARILRMRAKRLSNKGDSRHTAGMKHWRAYDDSLKEADKCWAKGSKCYAKADKLAARPRKLTDWGLL